MRKYIYIITTLFLGIGIADAAVRDINSVSRDTSKTTTRTADNAQKNTTARTTTKNTVSRTSKTARPISPAVNTSRGTKSVTNARTATTTARTTGKATAIRTPQQGLGQKTLRPARATITLNTTQSNTFGTDYNTCRDAYFTCMDQFCGTANDTYRRCICSSKLSEIQSRERALSNAADQIANFHSLNMTVIDKTAAEVNAMTSATAGEYAQSATKDTSNSANALSGISAVLSNIKNKSLSTQGTLDIAGDINSIWSTSNLTGGTNIANLTGEALYNAVHAQCSQMVIDKCPDTPTQTMVVSAYGMYIENDCSLLISALDKKLTNTNTAIRDSEQALNTARLENYNAHNSTTINDCIAQVRADITSDTACGPDYVHCLDFTGLYLNIETGEPIYSPQFYQLESQISLSNDILTNKTNRVLVAELNRKRIYATRGLDTCRDVANEVWDEFLRQAITEIYQGQQERIRTVKNECLDVVTNCYDAQNQSLKDFTNIKEQLLLGSRLELSEQMCRDKLDACSNLYGGGPHGLAALITAMHDITSQRIAKDCAKTLQAYARDLCTPPSNDAVHSYPFACRVYAPGEQIYATNKECNAQTTVPSNFFAINPSSDSQNKIVYNCPTLRMYKACKYGYYMTTDGKTHNDNVILGNKCIPCPSNCTCPGGTSGPKCDTQSCGMDYVGSLYHKLARYAMQACVRPSESAQGLPTTVLQDINIVMDQIHTDMAKELANECERLGGTWINKVLNTNDPKQNIHPLFYSETSANTKWGYCQNKQETESNTTKTTNTNTQ